MILCPSDYTPKITVHCAVQGVWSHIYQLILPMYILRYYLSPKATDALEQMVF